MWPSLLQTLQSQGLLQRLAQVEQWMARTDHRIEMLDPASKAFSAGEAAGLHAAAELTNDQVYWSCKNSWSRLQAQSCDLDKIYKVLEQHDRQLLILKACSDSVEDHLDDMQEKLEKMEVQPARISMAAMESCLKLIQF